MVSEIQGKAKTKMDAALEASRRELLTVRTGRASLSLLDDVRVDYFGTPTPINQTANMSVPEGNLIVIQPWDPSHIAGIERAILKANLGLTPSSDGSMIRVPVPPLTGERRKELAKKTHVMAEEAKTAVRQIRREANEEIKKAEKASSMSQDEAKKALKAIQDLTDEYVGKVDAQVAAKEKEILEF